MDLHATPFRAFVQVATEKSFTRAAQKLNISQPALSAMIRELERRLGFSLFTRTSRRVELTWEGRAFLINAKRVVTEHDWTAIQAKEILRNDLRLAVQTYSVLITDRVSLTDAYAVAHPDVDLLITQYGSDRIYDAVRAHDVDVAIVIEPADRAEQSPLNPAFGSELEALTLATRHLGLYLPHEHELCASPQISRGDLEGQRIAVVGRVHGGALATAITRYLAEAGVQSVRVPEGDAFSVVRYAARHRIAAVDLGWFAPLVSMPHASMTRRIIADHALGTELVAIRLRREQRPAADRFWRFAEEGAWRGDNAA